MKPFLLAIVAINISGCITTSSNYRNLEKGQQEISAGISTGGWFLRVPDVLMVPQFSPELSYRYGLTKTLNLRLQYFSTDILISGANVGLSCKLLSQDSLVPEVDLYFENGFIGFFMPFGSMESEYGVGPEFLGYISNRFSITSSYMFLSLLPNFGIRFLNPSSVIYFGISGSATAAIKSYFYNPILDTFLGAEHSVFNWFALQVEAKVGAAFTYDWSSWIPQLHPIIAIYPGIKVRF